MTLQDIVLLQCDKEIKTDFILVWKAFLDKIQTFSASEYIETNKSLFSFDPQSFLQDYYNKIDFLIDQANTQARLISTNRKYLFYYLFYNKHFHSLYEDHYNILTQNISEICKKESDLINAYAINNKHKVNSHEVH